MAQFTLTIQTAEAARPLAEALTDIGDNVTVREVDAYWDTGLGVQSQTVREVSATLGELWVPEAIELVHGWFWRERVPSIVLTISPPMLSHRIER